MSDERACPVCGHAPARCEPEPANRVDAAEVTVGQRVRAVRHGPTGFVTHVGHKWTTVHYGVGSMSYKHGIDKLYVESA